MVYACAYAPTAYRDQLAKQYEPIKTHSNACHIYDCCVCCNTNGSYACRAYADSKTLNEDRRELLFEAIQQDSQICFLYDALSATDISVSMLSR